jgi:protein-L-isoaspartate(D-aspartate) O-methyltransferase
VHYSILVPNLEKEQWERLIDGLVKQGILYSPKTIRGMRAVPRVKFLPTDTQSFSAKDIPLPIGFGQTISAPHIVSIMNEALKLQVGQKVLEVGAGSGWHASTIAELIASKDAPRSEWGHVYSVEIIKALAEVARKNIINVGFGDRVTVINADGSKGYPEKAPYDRILVTAAAPEVPQPLLDQLKVNGVLVVPVGDSSLFQMLLRLTKDENGKVKQENLGEVAFVPLTGEYVTH